VLPAAKLVGATAGAARFGNEAQLAMHAGTAPLPASSGKRNRHRLNRSGNRQLNCALHRIAINQGRWHPPARAYLARKQAEGKSRREALRCLKRHLARTVHRQLTSPANPKTPNPTTPTTPPHLTQEQRAARKRTTAQHPKRPPPLPARVSREAPYLT